MKNNADIDSYFNKNNDEIKSDYDSLSNSNFTDYSEFIALLKELFNSAMEIKGDLVELSNLFGKLTKYYLPEELKYIHKWLFKILKRDPSNFYVLVTIYHSNKGGELSTRHPDIQLLNTNYNRKLCDHYLGLSKCKLLPEKKSFLAEKLIYYKKQLIHANNDWTNTTQSFNPAIAKAFGVNESENYQSLIYLTQTQLEEIRIKEEHLFNHDGKSYFVYEPIIGQLFDLLVYDRALEKGKYLERINKNDHSRMKNLLMYNDLKGDPIEINLNPKRLVHSFCQLIYNEPDKLILLDKRKLGEWISNNFYLKNRNDEFQRYKANTINDYIKEYKAGKSRKELFIVIKETVRTKNGSKYRLEEKLYD